MSKTASQSDLDAQKLSFPVYSALSPETIKALGLGGTPQTIVVSTDGKVIKNWMGAYTETIQPEVETFFGVRLPGVKS